MNLEQVTQRTRLQQRAVAELTTAYMGQLLKCLTAEELELALLRNSLETAGICHLHDFCDPNQLLISAWDEVFEAPDNEKGCGETLDIQDSLHSGLLNRAQDHAHRALWGALE